MVNRYFWCNTKLTKLEQRIFNSDTIQDNNLTLDTEQFDKNRSLFCVIQFLALLV